MVIERYFKGIVFVMLMLSVVYLAMAASLTTIVISPAKISIEVNDTITFNATGLDENGNETEIAPHVVWSNSNTTVGTINETTGIFTAIDAGTTTITAKNGTDGTVSNSTTVTVTAATPVLTTITVSPSDISLFVGNTTNFTAAPKDQFGNQIDAIVTWSSSNTTVGTINATNATAAVFTAKAAGTAIITAINGSVTGNANVTVMSPFNFSLTVNPSNASITVPAGVNATYTLTLTNTGVQADSYSLTVDNTSIASLSNTTIDNLIVENFRNIFFNVSSSLEGAFSVNVTATSQRSGKSKNVLTTTNVISPFNVSLDIYDDQPIQPIPLNTTDTYKLKLKNTGDESDSYNLDVNVENGSVQTILSEYENITLKKDEQKDIFLYVNSSNQGNFTINVTANSLNDTKKTASVSIQSQFRNIYNVALNIINETYKKVSLNENATFEIKITNKGNVNDTYNITTNKSNAILSKESLTLKPNESVTLTMNFSSTISGNFIVRINATSQGDPTKDDSKNVEIFVPPKSYYSGDRIWDQRKHSNTTYTWDVYSFSGFYYNLDDNLGNESLTITNIGKIGRSLKEGDITYSTSPDKVEFAHSGFGSYHVIGFMADKYFAGYTGESRPSGNNTKSTIGSGQLHRVLLDDDDKRTVSEGGTLTLKEGYVLKITAVDVGAGAGQVWITLLKDGGEVDTDVVAGNEDYYYTKKVGGVSDLPLIAVHFDSVFRGREVNAVFIRGVFQISESYTQVKSGSKYGAMKVTGTTNGIQMKNDDTIDLSSGNTVDLMGNLKIKVANNDTLRFGLTVERTGTFEVRGTVYNKTGEGTNEWTPMNFGLNIGGTSIGFYYDMDEDIGNEKLWIVDGDVSGTSLQSSQLKYSTSPQEVSFQYDKFGSYHVIGFMADKYFAGYTEKSKPSDNRSKSTIGSNQLHKVLLDDDDKRTVSEGGTLTLKEGYVLKVTAVDIGAGAGQVWLTLLKDGGEVDTDVVAGNEDYYYTKKVGSVSDLPIIAVHFDSVFRGREVNAVFIKGVFQISESYTQVKSGNKYGAMKIDSVNSSLIKMVNDNTIDLSRGSTSDVMGNIKFKVADSDDLRFYPFVMVTSEMIANQLVIDAPAKANAGNNITIKVTAGGSAVDNASISIDSDIGKTDRNGVLDCTLPKTMKGTYNITATKLGYEKASRSIEIAEYIEYRLSIDAPAKANQFETITILVNYNTTPISGAIVKYDDDAIGTTDSNGALNFTPQTSGMHKISASKSGYITVSRDIEVIAPFSEYKALDINITPAFVFPGQKVVIRSNITNAGTKADTLPVDLIINGSVVDNRSVALDPHETKEINFTGNLKEWVLEEALPGNYTVEILGQKGLLEVREEPLNILLLGGIVTGFGAVIIYLLTAKKKLSVEAIRKLLGKFGKKGVKQVTPPEEGKV